MGTRTSLQQASDEYLKLLGYVADLPEGAEVRYEDVERSLGIKMTQGNRQKLRRAIAASGKECTTSPNIGYRLADLGTAMPIMVDGVRKIDRAVRRGERRYQVIDQQFYDRLPPEEQAGVRFVGAAYGAIRLAADHGKKVYGSPPRMLGGNPTTIDIPVP